MKRTVIIFALCLSVCLAAAGCSSFSGFTTKKSSGSGTEEQDTARQDGSARTEGDDTGTARQEEPVDGKPAHAMIMGTDFDDVVLPTQMSRSEKESIIINTGNFVGGTVKYRGVITEESLIKFLKAKMPEKGWEFGGSASAQKNTILAFMKRQKNCMFYISSGGAWNDETVLQIWIGSTLREPVQRDKVHHKTEKMDKMDRQEKMDKPGSPVTEEVVWPEKGDSSRRDKIKVKDLQK